MTFYPMVAHKADDDFSQPLQLLAKEIYFIDPILNQEMF
jgi:tRNA pseudouridine32 synthase/23S rRNA pseudouridine746 synthase